MADGLDSVQAMTIGTAGLTAMLCVMALERDGVKPGDGEVLVTGAAGGVGSVAISLLAGLGYTVVASTGRAAEALGVEIYPGFAARDMLYDSEGTVTGVVTGDMGVERGLGRIVDHRADVGRHEPRIADRKRLHCALDHSQHRVRDIVLHEQDAQCRTALAGRLER